MSFNPATASFSPIGDISSCLSGVGVESMAVSRGGSAYVEPHDQFLVLVDTRTSACRQVPIISVPGGYGNFGMGFADNVPAGGETLYAAEGYGNQQRLAWVDTTTRVGTIVGDIAPHIGPVELAGDGAGKLFASSGALVFELDRTTARVVAQSPTGLTTPPNGWYAFAFAIWGQDFYLFTSPQNNGATVYRFRPGRGQAVPISQATAPISGAGSTCP
jgi:hypothetical protein